MMALFALDARWPDGVRSRYLRLSRVEVPREVQGDWTDAPKAADGVPMMGEIPDALRLMVHGPADPQSVA